MEKNSDSLSQPDVTSTSVLLRSCALRSHQFEVPDD